MTTDPLRARITAYLANANYDVRNDQRADAILALVRRHATSDAAVEAAAFGCLNEMAKGDGGIQPSETWADTSPADKKKLLAVMRAAITAALGGGDG